MQPKKRRDLSHTAAQCCHRLLEQKTDIRIIQVLLEAETYCPLTPIEGRICYPVHPRCGESVLIFGQYAYRDAELVVIPQPDGSVACLPVWMTHRPLRSLRQRQPGANIALARQLLGATDRAPSTDQSDGAEGGQDDEKRNTCSYRGGRVRSSSRSFEPGCQPQLWPIPAIGFDSS